MLKWTFEKFGVDMYPGFSWLMTLTSGGFVKTIVNFK
jgi:hypothetical protein